MGIFAADGARGCQQTDATIAGQGSGRLDGRHHPHHRNAQGGSQGWQGYGAGGVAGDHHQIDGVFGHHVADQAGAGRDQLWFAQLAIGEVGVVEAVEIVVRRQGATDLPIDGQAAHTGVEHENIGHQSSPLDARRRSYSRQRPIEKAPHMAGPRFFLSI